MRCGNAGEVEGVAKIAGRLSGIIRALLFGAKTPA
jgi:hypothetical protein